jgi:hypothetical protein
MFDWLFPAIGSITSKVAESLATEIIKKWVVEGKSDSAKRNLLDLYEKVTLLEYSSQKFVFLLDDYVEGILKRVDYKPDNFNMDALVNAERRWYRGWSNLLLKQANDVAQQLNDVSELLLKLNPQAEIYLPEVVAFLEKYKRIPDGEGGFAIKMGIKRDTDWGELSWDELLGFTAEIKKEVDNLSKMKDTIRNFIHNEFSFVELTKLDNRKSNR